MRALSTAALLLAGPVLASAGEHVRLGSDVVPVRQEVRLKLDPRAETYGGSVRIELDVRKAGAPLRVHAQEMTITSAAVDGAPATHAAGPDSTLVVTPARPLTAGQAVLTLEFTNEYDRRQVGLYKMARGDDGYLYTQFEPIDARKAFPCYDEPGFKIPYQLTVEVPSGYDAVSNTPDTAGPEKDGWKEVRFAQTKPLPSYLVALAVGKFAFVPIEGMGVPGRVVTVRGQEHLAQLATQMTPALLKAAETYFGRPYPYEKLDLIAVPEYWPGAMEHPGAITFADYILLVDQATATPSQRSLLARVDAHELAHMWFGDLVTMAWWDDIWLNESFADWLGDKLADQVYPELQVGLSELATVQNTMVTDRRAAAVSIRRPVENPTDTLRSVGLTYYKGKSVLGMFERWLGPERFREGVQVYMRENEWKNATSDRLWKALDRVARNDISSALATFIDQPGLPLVTLERLGGGRVRLSQTRYARAGVTLPAQTWKVPVAIRYGNGKTSQVETVLLDGPTREIVLPSPDVQWVFPSAEGSGYYRWNLPAAELDLLAAHAAERLSPAERIAFLGNLTALLEAGRLDGGRYLKVLAPFGSDPDAEVLEAALAELGKLELPFLDDSTRAGFATYVRTTFRPALDRIGLTPRPGEPAGVTSLRPDLLTALAEHGDDARVLRFASEGARSLLAGQDTVPPSLRGTVLQVNALHGDAALFEEYKKRFESASSPAERNRYLTGVGGFRDPKVRAQALAWSLTLRPNEMGALAAAFRDTPAGRVQVFDWVSANFEAILGRVPPLFHASLTNVASGCERERVQEAQRIFAAKAVEGAADELTRVGEQVEECVALRSRESGAVGRFLRQAQPPAGASGRPQL
jgi:alanyl aminopeptidase